MKGAMVYHQIKCMRKDHTVRECARKLGVSVNTVRKYAAMDIREASTYLGKVKRGSQYDVARTFIEQYLDVFPKITATKLLRKVKAQYPRITGKVRGFRKYLLPLRKRVNDKAFRHYAPVLDMQPGVQVQVDIGEESVCRHAPSGNEQGDRLKVYFVSFVFSYSRKGFVTFRGRCYDTDSFIGAHEQAFAYFGGIAEEYVYDQTKLVVIEERFREVLFNERFHQFALQHGFRIRVCEGYDPESKGKVERFIGYVKSDFLYGDYHADVSSLNERGQQWLEGIANERIHSITARKPSEMFEEERPLLKPFVLQKQKRRYADKTGLISYQGNKYSVPYPYQRGEVVVEESDGTLRLFAPHTGEEIARHRLCSERGKVIKNNNHYRDYRKDIETIYAEALDLFGGSEGLGSDLAVELLHRLRKDNPQIARDQLRAMIMLRGKFGAALWDEAIGAILALPTLRATVVESILESYQRRGKAKAIDEQIKKAPIPGGSVLDRPLDDYMEVIDHAG